MAFASGQLSAWPTSTDDAASANDVAPATRICGALQLGQNAVPSSTRVPHLLQGCSTDFKVSAQTKAAQGYEVTRFCGLRRRALNLSLLAARADVNESEIRSFTFRFNGYHVLVVLCAALQLDDIPAVVGFTTYRL